MPWITPWVDPDTGATYPTSYVVPDEPQPDVASRRIVVSYRRWATIDTYSLGKSPIEMVATVVTGTQFMVSFASQFQQAHSQFMLSLQGAAGSFLSQSLTFSGAQAAP